MTLPKARDYRGPTTLVIDVSHWQGDIDWPAVAADDQGIAAAIVRMGDGKDRDRKAVRNLRGARDAGLLVGAYRYLRAEHPVELQLGVDEAVLAEAGVTLDLPLCADLEGGPDPDGDGPRKARGAWQDVRSDVVVDTADVLACTRRYTEGATELVGLESWLYTGRSWLDHVRTPPAWAESVPLWLAVGAGGRVPRPWTQPVMWQYSAKGRVRGIDGNVDVNRFFGTAADLRALRGPSVVPASDVDYAAELHRLAEGAPDDVATVLRGAARELGALASCR